MKLLHAISAIAFSSSLFFGVTACGDDEEDTTATTAAGPTGGGTDGTTECGGVTCQAGQYCDNLLCENGCLSNANCAGDQTCDLSQSSPGTCQNNMMGGGTTLDQVCTKLQACDPSVTQAMCEQFYNGTNGTCHDCVVGANCSDENACTSECNL